MSFPRIYPTAGQFMVIAEEKDSMEFSKVRILTRQVFPSKKDAQEYANKCHSSYNAQVIEVLAKED